MDNTTTEWLAYAKKAANACSTAEIVDEKGALFSIAWKSLDILSPELALSEIAAERLSKSELAFLKKNPKAVSSELFLRACEPLLENGVENVDWDAVQATIKTSVKQFYIQDLSKFGPDLIKPLMNDIYFCATITKPQAKDPLGFLLFSITPALSFGDVKVINFFMKEEAGSVDLSAIFMRTIFQILPEAKRIFLFVRPTDSVSLDLYAEMGFTKDKSLFEDPNHKINRQYLVPLEYRIGNSTRIAKRIAEEYAERVWNHKDLSAIDEFLSRECVIHSLLGDFYGPKSMKKIVQTWLSGFPDLIVNNTEVVAENDFVVIHWRAQGSHQGEFKGLPGTGKPVFYSGATIYRIRQDKIVEYWAYLDMQHLLAQISRAPYTEMISKL